MQKDLLKYMRLRTLPASSMSDIAISVVMTTYNGQKYLAEQLDSLMAQHHTNFELIISDDGSDDRTIEIASRYLNDPRVKLARNPGPGGMVNNLTYALSFATGDYISICDQDDIWQPNKLDRMIAEIGDHSAIFCDSELVDANGQALGKSLLDCLSPIRPDIGDHCARLIRMNFVSGHALLFRRELLSQILPFNDTLVYDHQIAMIAALNNGIKLLDETLIKHRQHENNLVNDYQGLQSPRVKPNNRLEKRFINVKFALDYIAEKIQQLPEEQKNQPNNKALINIARIFNRQANDEKRYSLLEKFSHVFFLQIMGNDIFYGCKSRKPIFVQAFRLALIWQKVEYEAKIVSRQKLKKSV